MDLQEEYFIRKKVPGHLIRFAEKANCMLKAKNDQEFKYLWFSVEQRSEPNHPINYHIMVCGNPYLYSTSEFTHFSLNNNQIIHESRAEWDNYENVLFDFASNYSKNYIAICKQDVLIESWQMLLANYDTWLSYFLPYKILDEIYFSFESKNSNQQRDSMKTIEEWFKRKHERIYSCWNNVKHLMSESSYADWLADIFNDFGGNKDNLTLRLKQALQAVENRN